MKKIVTFFAVSLLFLNTIQANDQQNCCAVTKAAEETSCYFGGECSQAFLTGVAAGAAAGVSVEVLRNYVLPDMTSWKLYDNYGICRDRLEGMFKAVAASFGLAAVNATDSTNFKKTTYQLVGILVGACAASYATKLLTPVAAPVTTQTPQ